MNLLKITPLLLILLVTSCQENNKTANVYSYEIDSQTDKIEFLKKYLNKTSGLIDAEYHIWYQDNGTGRVPGPSDYNIILALKIQPDSINSWINHLEPSSRQISTEKWNELNLNKKNWNLHSQPELYLSSQITEVKLLFRKENIVLGAYSTMPINLDYIDTK
jgi:hypothetical protein